MIDRFLCQMPERQMAPLAAGELCRWPHYAVKVGIDPSMNQLGLAGGTVTQALWEVGELLKAVGQQRSFTVEIVPTGRQADCHVWISSAWLGGRGGVLAQAYIPCGNPRPPLAMQFDYGDVWDYDLFLRVLLHELLHSLGIGHTNAPSNIMQPTIGTGTAFALGSWDTAELKARYPLRNVPPPQPPPTDPKPPTPTPQPPPMPSGRWQTITYVESVGGIFGGGTRTRTVEVWTKP